MAEQKNAANVVDRVDALAAEKMKCGVPRHTAYLQVAHEHPELREEYDRQYAAHRAAQGVTHQGR